MKNIATIITVLLLTVFGISCEKEQPACKSNCFTALIKGRVYNKTSLQGFANIPVEAEWHRAAYCIGCTVYNVSAGRTDANGNFNLSKEIDTTFFKDYFLSIKIPADSNYFINLLEKDNRYFVKRFYNFEPGALQQINFELYPKVPLTIRLRRTQQDNFVNYLVGHYFETNYLGSTYNFNNPPIAFDTIIHQQTAPGVFTKVAWRKNFTGNIFTEGVDSIICTAGGNNTIDVNF